jgi:hypothetical protein
MHIIGCHEVYDEMFLKSCLDLKHYLMRVLVISGNSKHFCQTPYPDKNKVDFSYLAKKKKSKKNKNKLSHKDLSEGCEKFYVDKLG